MEKKKRHIGRKILLVLLAVAVIYAIINLVLKFTVGKTAADGAVSGQVPRVELDWDEAMADGVLSHEELATHYAPDIDAAVNVLLSDGGRGDFITAVDYDGDWNCANNWQNVTAAPLAAVVYYSVQETETHYFIGYDFYHPRDDAEVWLDRHENDFEGILLSVRKAEDGFGTVEVMYTQGHGGVPFFFDTDSGLSVTAGSHRDGGLLLDGDCPIIYITPNGTLDYAGHSVESALDHSVYWSVGNSGIRYYNGGTAEVPATWNGAYTDNRCSYELRSLDELWDKRNKPHNETSTFGEYAAFNGDDWEKNAANPAWGWRNKTDYGFGGSFLSDPAWTLSCALDGLENFSHTYVNNPYADHILTVTGVTLPADGTYHLVIRRDGRDFSKPVWTSIVGKAGDTLPVSVGPAGVDALYIAAPKDSEWSVLLADEDGNEVANAVIDWQMTRIGE